LFQSVWIEKQVGSVKPNYGSLPTSDTSIFSLLGGSQGVVGG